VRENTLGGGGQETVFPVSKVPRQCSLVLRIEAIEAMHMIGINLFYDIGKGYVIVKFDLILGWLH
jgi:hypothetical protein